MKNLECLIHVEQRNTLKYTVLLKKKRNTTYYIIDFNDQQQYMYHLIVNITSLLKYCKTNATQRVFEQ